MFKFLRRYNKLILAIGGGLLMISFLIMDAIPRLSQSMAFRGTTSATVGDGESVSALEMDIARREVGMLEKLTPFGFRLPGLDQVKRPEHWFLLVREATAAGLVPTPGSVRSLLNDQTLQTMMAVSETRNPHEVLDLLAKVQGVSQMLQMYQGSQALSDRRMRSQAERLLHQVNAEFVVLEASADQVRDEPSEEALAAQFEKYKDIEPGQGEMGFGYRLPNRVKLEWLVVPADAVREMVRRSDQFDGVAQNLHWRRNPDKVFPPFESGAPVPEVVSNDLLERQTREALERIAKDAMTKLQVSQRLAVMDGYLVLPEDWNQRMLSFTQLAEDLQQRHGIETPRYESTGARWISVDELSELAGVGSATTDRFGPTPINLGALVSNTKEFGKTGMVAIQEGIAGPPLRGADGSVYLFRVIDTDPARSPTSLDEVREQIVDDLKRKQQYEAMIAGAAELEREAEERGLLSVALEHDTIVQPTTPVYLVNRGLVEFMIQGLQAGAAQLPVVGADEDAIAAIIDYARALPGGLAVSALPVEQQVLVVPSSDQLAVLVTKLVNQDPLTREKFNDLAQKGVIQRLLAERERSEDEALMQAFSLEALVKRHNFASKSLQETDENGQPIETAAVGG